MLDDHVYVLVYFRIEAGYHGGEGMSREQTEAFFIECEKILESLGFSVEPPKFSGDCPTGTRGAESLYCHPQELSGYIIREKVAEIESVLSSAKTFRHYHTDLYGEALNYTENEFRAALAECRPKLERDILAACVTKRKNLFKVFGFFSMGGLSSGLKFFCHSGLEGIEQTYILHMLDRLTGEGKLEKGTTKSGVGYRTIMPVGTNEYKKHGKQYNAVHRKKEERP